MLAVSTPTRKSFNTLMKAFEKEGWLWFSGKKPTYPLEYWEKYKSKTCVIFEDKFSFYYKQRYKNEGYEIISVKEALKRLKKDVCPYCGK